MSETHLFTSESVTEGHPDKIADQISVDAGTLVTYTYLLTNTGDVPLATISVTDDLCAPLTFDGGDANSEQTAFVAPVVADDTVGATMIVRF